MTTEADILADINGGEDEKTETQPTESAESSPTESSEAAPVAEETAPATDGSTSDEHAGGSGAEGGSVGEGETDERSAGSEDKNSSGDGAEVVEPKNELMSPADLARKQKFENWQLGFNQKLGNNIAINVDGVVEITGASDEEIEVALQVVSETELTSNAIANNMKLTIAELALEMSARNNEDTAQTASRYNICETIGRSIKTFYRWIRVVEEIPKNKLKYGLFMSQYEAVACVRHPKDKANDMQFINARNKILDAAAANPKDYGSRQMANELKAVLDKLDATTASGLSSAKITPAKSQPVMIESLNSYRIIYAAAVNPEILDDIGITKAQLNDIITSNEAILIEREILNPDLTTITFIPDVIDGGGEEPEPIEVESEEITEPEGDQNASTHSEGENEKPEEKTEGVKTDDDPKNRKNKKKDEKK